MRKKEDLVVKCPGLLASGDGSDNLQQSLLLIQLAFDPLAHTHTLTMGGNGRPCPLS